MAKNGGESRIPVSRAVRPSYLSKPKIVGPSKSGISVAGTVGHRGRSSILSGSFNQYDPEEILCPTTPRQWTGVAHFTSTPADGGKPTERNFPSPGLWTFSDDLQSDLSQRKLHNYFSESYGQVSMLDDLGDSCLLDDTTTNTLNTTQYLALNKQNSFEHDESLGILTPDQMTDFTVASCENLSQTSRQAAGAATTITATTSTTSSSSRASRPTDIPFVVDIEATGVLAERSPSLEELPLDPKPATTKLSVDQPVINQTTVTSISPAIITGITTTSTSLPMSFVTSITSITSLEAGYQGDGENSRPASRGPDPPAVNLPATCRLQDPMTDSDFFTESDADAHEDIGRGDRRAQVIDGTLFCAPGGRKCPSFAGEEMDSSGIYSDLDKRQDERYNLEEAFSAEDQTPDTADTGDTADTQVSPRCQISPNTLPATPQIIMDYLEVTANNPRAASPEASPEKHEITVIDVTAQAANRAVASKIQNKTDTSTLKKYKMPKKNVASKIKAMIESGAKDESVKEPRRVLRSPRKSGRWDAVMSKIEASKTEQRSRPIRKDVKSRLMQNLAPTSSSSASSASSSSAATVASAKRLNGDANKDKRRSRIRQDISSPLQETARSSVRSSMSDLSSAASKSIASKRSPATINSQQRVVNGRQSLKSRTTNNDTKKACTLDLSPINLEKSPTPIRKTLSTRRTINHNNVTNEKQNGSVTTPKERTAKEFSAISSISPRIIVQTRDQEAQTEINCDSTDRKCNEGTIQALCLTVQYLTRQLDESTKARANLEDQLENERKDHQKALDDLRAHLEASHAECISDLENALRHEKNEFESRLKASLNELKSEHVTAMERLTSEHILELQAKETFWRNKQVTTEIHEEFSKMREEYEALKLYIKPIMALKNRVNTKLRAEIVRLREQLDEKDKLLSSELVDCGALSGNDQVATLRAEIWSLRSVLELRSQENSTMRSENEILRRENEIKEALEQRVETLEARCEDLKAQLQGKESYEREISHQNEILLGSFHEITKHNKRLTQRNEELQWRLRQKNEVVSVLANQLATPTPRLSRSLGPEHIDHSIIADNSQPASSSMIKFMVQKGDSVSWTLEIDESCDPMPHTDEAPTITRQNSLRRPPRKSLDVRARSKSISTADNVSREGVWSPAFNSTPVPTRRRPRSDPSSSAITTTTTSVTSSENNLGPRPQEAGGEAMISEEASATSSEDESSASSDIPRLDIGY